MKFIKNKWLDPVWSKVFAGIILAVGGIIVSGIWALVTKISFPNLWNDMISRLGSRSEWADLFDLSKKSNLLLWLSSGILYLIAAIVLSFQTLLEKGTSFLSKIGTAFIGIIICVAISFLFFWLFSFLPQIDKDNWIWNYLVNFGIQTIIVFMPVSRARKKSYS